MSKLLFKDKHSYNKRLQESTRIKLKYPDRIPIIVDQDKNLPIIDKQKFLVPCDLTVGQFMFVLRKRITLKPEDAIFLFVNNSLPPTSTILSKIYGSEKDEDGFLYVNISGENTFG